MNTPISREFLWQIPHQLIVVMYISCAIALLVFLGALKIKLTGTNLITLIKKEARWNKLIFRFFGFKKIYRRPIIAIAHTILFFGFGILLLATILAGISIDSTYKIFTDDVYAVVSFFADIAGILILIGFFINHYNHCINKITSYSKKNLRNERYLLVMIFFIFFTGYLLEATRIYNTQAIFTETWTSPIGWSLAIIFSKNNNFRLLLSKETTPYLWAIHMLSSFTFIAVLPFTKLVHIIMFPFAALITSKRGSAVLSPTDLTNSKKESFGLATSSDLSQKQKLDLINCIECGLCRQVCPAVKTHKKLDPRNIILQIRNAKKNDYWNPRIFSNNELDACTTCGACFEECPANIEHIQFLMELRRYKALMLGEIPLKALTAIKNITRNGTPWGINHTERFIWGKELNLPIASTKQKLDILIFVGCAGNVDDKVRKSVIDTSKLLSLANISYAFLGPNENCCGDPIRRLGDEYTFQEIALKNIKTLNEYSFNTLLTTCPHCLHTLGNEYPLIEKCHFEILHHTEYIESLFKCGALPKKNKTNNAKISFHDPCYLGRHRGSYSPARSILIHCGYQINELVASKDKSLCCGMGGGNMWHEIAEGEDYVHMRLNDIATNPPKILATACPFCTINFDSAKTSHNTLDKTEIQDIASICAKELLMFSRK